MSKEKKEELAEAFVGGAECAIYLIRKNLSGSALQMFDLHSYQIEDLLNQVKKQHNIIS